MSLIELVRKRFLETIRSVKPPGRWKILVVDDHSQKLLGANLKTYDILEENVTEIQSISNNRSPQSLEALYLLMPTSQNVERIIADFSDGRQQYGAAHIFFIDGLPEKLFERLMASPARPHVKGLVDLFINFWAIEAKVFSLYAPSLFFSFFSPPRSPNLERATRLRVLEDLRFTARSILNLCVSLGEYPLIRYYLPHHHPPLGAFASTSQKPAPAANEGSGRWRALSSRSEASTDHSQEEHLTKALATMVQEELDDYKKSNPEFPPLTEPLRPRGILLITDRSMDTAAPFLHEFTYQAACNDLLPIEDGVKYRYKFQSAVGGSEDMAATLSDADTIWTEIRHMHIAEASDKLRADFNKFLEEHAGFKGDGAASLNDMKDMLANLPQYKEQREKFSLHLNMAEEVFKMIEKHKVSLTANVEQNCATGLTSEGKTPKTLVEEMVPLLDDRSVSNSDKVRIIALYIMYRDGVPDEDRRRLFQHARLNMTDQDAINNLARLGMRVTRVPGDRDTKKKLKYKPGSESEEYELSRYRPLINTMVEEHFAGRLDFSGFPYMRDPPSAAPAPAASVRTAAPTSLRSAKPSWHRAPRTNPVSESKQRAIIFVAGGMTYSEMRSAYQLGNSLNKDVYIGSTHAITPEGFIDDLKVIELQGAGSRAVPNGLPTPSSEPRSYQEYYDQKYYTRDAPPPPRPTTAPIQGSGRTGGSGSLGPPQPSPQPSYSSLRGEKKEKEKKKGFLRF